MVSGEEDFTKRFKGKIDHWWIKGIELQDPTIAACLPISVENPAIAYDAVYDRFKVDLAAVSAGTFDVNVTDKWARELGKVDIAKYLGSDMSVDNPLHTQIAFEGGVIDPRNIREITEPLIRIRNMNDDLDEIGYPEERLAMPVVTKEGDILEIHIMGQPDEQIGEVSGSIGNPFAQRPVTEDIYAQLRHEGAEIDPRDTSDRATRELGIVYGNLDQLQQRATSKDLLVQIRSGGGEVDPTEIRTLTASDIVTIARAGTPIHFSLAASGTIHTPASGKKVRLHGFFWSSDADIITSLRFGAAGSNMFPLQKTGVAAMNLISLGPLEGDADVVLYGYLSGAGNMKGTVFIEEV